LNQKRADLGLPELNILVAALVENEGKHEKLSSTHLREIKSSKCSEETRAFLKEEWEFVANTLSISSDQSEIW